MLNEDIESYIETEIQHFIKEHDIKQELIDNEISDEFQALEQLNLYDKVTEHIDTDWLNILDISDARNEDMALMELICEIDDDCLYEQVAYQTVHDFLTQNLFELLERIFNEILTDYIKELLEEIEEEELINEQD